MRPDLYAGLTAGMPFVDVLNTMLDETLPLTPPEWPEWGDPIRDAAAFRTILAYSPYENVRAESYPAILALAGLTDPRVLVSAVILGASVLGCARRGASGTPCRAITTSKIELDPESETAGAVF
jgi:hypothetical protein